MTFPTSPGRLIRIDFACNNPDNGDFEGRVEMIAYRGEDGLLLTIQTRKGAAFTVDDRWVRLHRRVVLYRCRKVWHGNWAWDAFWLTPFEAKRLLRAVRASEKWTVDGGDARLVNWFERRPA